MVNNLSRLDNKNSLLKQVLYHKQLYILLLPTIAFYAIFCYVPMYGIILAFKDFQYNTSFINMPWVGIEHFHRLLTDVDFLRALKNTIIISLCRLVFQFPIPIIFAIFLNEMKTRKLQRFYQTVYTFPHFISWVLVVGVINSLLSSEGFVNQLIMSLGGNSVNFLTDSKTFFWLLFITDNWKEVGWGTIIYIAALSSINPEQYEAAYCDGANRLQRIIHVSWPGISSTVVILLILNVGNIMNNGNFDQIFNMYNPAVYNKVDIIDTYLFRITFQSGNLDYAFSTAVGLFKSVINVVLLYTVNTLVTRSGNEGIY